MAPEGSAFRAELQELCWEERGEIAALSICSESACRGDSALLASDWPPDDSANESAPLYRKKTVQSSAGASATWEGVINPSGSFWKS